MENIVKNVGQVNSENLDEVFQKCTEVFKDYLIAHSDDNLNNSVINTVGEFLNDHISSEEYQNLKELNSRFTDELK